MPPTTSYDFGDIVLVFFPFSNRAGGKHRPAAVASSAAYNRARPDLVIMAVTSQLRPSLAFGEVAVSAWKRAGLLKPSVIKPVFATLERTLVLRTLGRLEAKDRDALRANITALLR